MSKEVKHMLAAETDPTYQGRSSTMLSRRGFVRVGTLLGLAVMTAGGLIWTQTRAAVQRVSRVGIRFREHAETKPVKLEQFCRKAKFKTAADAYRAAASRGRGRLSISPLD